MGAIAVASAVSTVAAAVAPFSVAAGRVDELLHSV